MALNASRGILTGIGKGEFGELRSWLASNLHRRGRHSIVPNAGVRMFDLARLLSPQISFPLAFASRIA